ncbi:DUF5681 domain-containing protein [Stenotrophobium rhamnosiphilum]|uniref:DUF5681 domain-containing protein n=1 Tax=Stenotrophobium rhamnosiphilum TaxID=2029166 RepID=A0A2T5MBN1_9GAMM|nr:DUF5681 domain-containing protein [Stenotrophobium rhamnosiphilum]PTU29154.1 hypothetical protein CJD38_17560 [Stenotrophobium rhamnosiphilum]
MSKKNGTKPYAVGYAKPPKSGQFKSGTSGNKRGRPKNRPSAAMQVYSQLAQKITVTVDGKRKKITVREAIVTKAVHSALAGDYKAINFLLNFATPSEREMHSHEPKPDYSKMTAEELSDLYRKTVAERH